MLAAFKTNRARFLVSLVLGIVMPIVLAFAGRNRNRRRQARVLRPPGALIEDEFLNACIRCGQCANVCPNKCITFQGWENGLAEFGSPVIHARTQACILCMACTQVCPTGALKKLPMTMEGKLSVQMGRAVVLEDVCYSYAGRTCGVCYRACPLPGKAMTLGLYEQPRVHAEYCVGCGLCEQACVHMPQAIKIIPAVELASLQS